MNQSVIPASVLKLVRRSSRTQLLAILSGLMLSPQYAANHKRLILLLQVVLVESAGSHPTRPADLSAMLNGLLHEPAGRGESEPANLFISEIAWAGRAFRVFNSSAPGTDFLLGRMLDAAASHTEVGNRLAKAIESILVLSETVANRLNLPANLYARGAPRRVEWPSEVGSFEALGDSTVFTPAMLAELGVHEADLATWTLPSLSQAWDTPADGRAALWARPLVREHGVYRLPAPSLVPEAVRFHLVDAVNAGILPGMVEEDFYTLGVGRWMRFDLPLRGGVPLLMSDSDRADAGWLLPQSWRMPLVDTAFRFDENKLLHLLVLNLDWADVPAGSIDGVGSTPARLGQELIDFARERRLGLGRENDVTGGGMALVVVDSPGWGLDLPASSEIDRDWFYIPMKAEAFDIFLGLPDFSLLDLWKFMREVLADDRTGPGSLATADLLARWGAWTSEGRRSGRGQVRDAVGRSDEAGSASTFAVRLLAQMHRARGRVPLPTGEWPVVERLADAEASSAEFAFPIRFDPLQLALGDLRGVVDTSFGPWWLSIGRPPESPEEAQFHNLIWQGGLHWLHLLATAAVGRLSARSTPILVEVVPTPERFEREEDAPILLKFPEVAQARLITPSDFVDRLSHPDNQGELEWLKWLADAILLARGEALSERELKAWIEAVAGDPDLKMIHVNRSRDLGHAADSAERRTRFRTLQGFDLAVAAREASDAAALGPSLDAIGTTDRVDGKASVRRALHSIVAHHWTACEAMLSTLNRKATVALACGLIEGLHRRRVQAERSARARQALFRADMLRAPNRTGTDRVGGRWSIWLARFCPMNSGTRSPRSFRRPGHARRAGAARSRTGRR